MKTQAWACRVSVARGLLLALALAVAGCSIGQSTSSTSSGPEPPATASPGGLAPSGRAPWLLPEAQLTDYSTRLGNNRVAAETAIKLGRSLYFQQQYWEVYVTTDPAVLKPAYDPSNPSTLDLAARVVSRVDVLIATESGPAIKAFGAGGAEHEKAQLIGLAQQLLPVFPSARTIGFQVLFGENNPHASATFQAGHLDYHVISG
jgi:hypothetical protein